MKTRHARRVMGAAIAALGLSAAGHVFGHGPAETTAERVEVLSLQPGDRGVYGISTSLQTLGGGDPGTAAKYQAELFALEEGSLGISQNEGVFLRGSPFVVRSAEGESTYWQDAGNGSIFQLVDAAGRHFYSTSGGPGGVGLPLIPAYLQPGESARYNYVLSFPSKMFPHATGNRIVTMGPAETLATPMGDVEAHRFTLVDARQTDGVNERIESELWFSSRYGLMQIKATVIAEDGEHRTVATTSSSLRSLAIQGIAAVN